LARAELARREHREGRRPMLAGSMLGAAFGTIAELLVGWLR
jgi:hypothetical protein